MGAQPYTELYRMGDLPMPVGVRCRSCGTRWSTIEALAAGEPGSAEEIEPVEGLDEAPRGAAENRTNVSSPVSGLLSIAVFGAGIALALAGFLELVIIPVMAAVLLARFAWTRRAPT
jgi:hypothetical protein